MAEGSDQSRVARFKFNLEKSRSPGAFRGEENLWEDDLRRIYRLVRHQVGTLKEAEKSDRTDRSGAAQTKAPHLSIAVFGPSGSGKSSLLRTLADDASRPIRSIKEKSGLEGNAVVSLPPMDPTTWSESDQFLYAFLAAALEQERKHQDDKDRGYPQGLSPVQLAFQDVNEYLRVVDDFGTPEEHDPLGMSLQKLERHTSGLRLREALGAFIEALAKEFGAEVVLLPVDDLDMAPDHLVNSLQAYQSFLTHERLVPVFTFTDRMPEELIEAHYDDRIGRGGKHRRLEGATERLSISEQLAVQFLARCFPVRNRIRLGPAPGRVQRAMFGLNPERKEGRIKEKELQVLELLTISSFLLFGHPDSEDAHKVRASLRPSTLRRQFQVIDAMFDCRLYAMRAPQLAKMASPAIHAHSLAKIATFEGIEEGVRVDVEKSMDDWGAWSKKVAHGDHRAMKVWEPEHEQSPRTLNGVPIEGYRVLAYRLRDLDIGATWASMFNRATWSLLNVHRDTLRELGLFLEDLYSWSPKELRSVVLNSILEQDRAVRRTIVDRWFNRSDIRRSQVLSLLAANAFRPWMEGEEPYGDDEGAIRTQLRLETKYKHPRLSPVDVRWDDSHDKDKETLDRLTFSSLEGLLWFLNVTLGFYLPQVLARGWAEALASDEPVRERMNGSGWDLHRAPINAMRIADARQEAFSFGIMFLDSKKYREALEKLSKGDAESEDPARSRNHMLLRIWSCYGYSRSRFWTAISLWRGLGFIGQVLDLGARKRLLENEEDLVNEIKLLIHSHCLTGMVPGSLLNRSSDERRLQQGFPPWEPHEEPLGGKDGAIMELANDLLKWLRKCQDDRIFPFPAGDLWIGWRDCFIRRIHGEYILGSLWPRLNSAYLEELGDDCPRSPDEEDRFLWTASRAASAWSELLLDYWRGCAPIIRLLLTCPVFLKKDAWFDEDSNRQWFEHLTGSPKLLDDLYGVFNKKSKENDSRNELGKIPDEFCISRVPLAEFATVPPALRRSLSFEKTAIRIGKKKTDNEEHERIAELETPRQDLPGRRS